MMSEFWRQKWRVPMKTICCCGAWLAAWARAVTAVLQFGLAASVCWARDVQRAMCRGSRKKWAKSADRGAYRRIQPPQFWSARASDVVFTSGHRYGAVCPTDALRNCSSGGARFLHPARRCWTRWICGASLSRVDRRTWRRGVRQTQWWRSSPVSVHPVGRRWRGVRVAQALQDRKSVV